MSSGGSSASPNARKLERVYMYSTFKVKYVCLYCTTEPSRYPNSSTLEPDRSQQDNCVSVRWNSSDFFILLRFHCGKEKSGGSLRTFLYFYISKSCLSLNYVNLSCAPRAVSASLIMCAAGSNSHCHSTQHYASAPVVLVTNNQISHSPSYHGRPPAVLTLLPSCICRFHAHEHGQGSLGYKSIVVRPCDSL